MCVCGAAEAVGGGGPASQQLPSVLSTEGTRAQHLQLVLKGKPTFEKAVEYTRNICQNVQ